MRGRRMTPALGVAIAASLSATTLLAACGPASTVRVYDEVVVVPSPVDSLFAGSAPAAESPLAWSLPGDWQEFAGDSIRLATFEVTGAGARAETTIVSLAGDAGGPRANVARWLDQLGVSPSDDQLDQIMSEAPRILTAQGQTLAVYDLTDVSPPGADSTIGALGTFGSETVFVKMNGPAALLRQQRPALEQLVGSLRSR